MKTKLETTAGLTATDLFLNDSAQGRLDAIREEALAEVFDVSTDAGRKLCISHAAKVTKTKTAVDKIGKALVEPLKADAKKVDADRKLYRDGLDALKAEVRKPVTDWEAAEAAKAASLAKAFDHLEASSVAHNPLGELFSDTVLQAKLNQLESLEVADFGDESAKAQELIFSGKTKIRAAIQQRKDADELAELRRAKAAQEAEAERLAEVARIEEAAVAKHEEQMRIKEKALVDPVLSKVVHDSEEKPVLDSVDTENTPSKMPWLDESPKQRTAMAIHSALIDDLVEFAGLEAGQARKVLDCISACEIRNLKIQY